MKPYYEHAGITIYHGDCYAVAELLPYESVDVVVADPPYGETSLEWDTWRRSWVDLIAKPLKANCSLWVFGSFRMFLKHSAEFAGWRLAQEIVWEKQNGSSFHADRFKRVHEIAAHFYQGEWTRVYKCPIRTADATARTVRRKRMPGRFAHIGYIGSGAYVSHEGGPRLMRSVIRMRNCNGYAEHPTQKPESLVDVLLGYSAPPNGFVFSPFLGSGTDLVVAKRRGLTAVGCDTRESCCEIAAKRLSQEVLDLTEAST